ncbi:MAG: DUF3870 domain-containing protein [Clostridiales Family XIII bacterium]|jgi:hypothetical protein|nr:DUF3870 domain-containing protein [Clostridiales Family XIII bacterium]
MNTVLLSGYAKLPSNITSSKLYDTLVIVVTVDLKSGVILESDCSLSTNLSRKFVSELINGYNLNGGIEALIRRFEKQWYGSTRKAIITAIKTIYEKYNEAVV